MMHVPDSSGANHLKSMGVSYNPPPILIVQVAPFGSVAWLACLFSSLLERRVVAAGLLYLPLSITRTPPLPFHGI